MKELNVTFDEILKEIDNLNNKHPEGFTILQMSESTGYSRKWCQQQIAKLIDSGKAICNGRIKGNTIDGRIKHVGVYKLI